MTTNYPQSPGVPSEDCSWLGVPAKIGPYCWPLLLLGDLGAMSIQLLNKESSSPLSFPRKTQDARIVDRVLNVMVLTGID